jgi:hypothetical protein
VLFSNYCHSLYNNEKTRVNFFDAIGINPFLGSQLPSRVAANKRRGEPFVASIATGKKQRNRSKKLERTGYINGGLGFGKRRGRLRSSDFNLALGGLLGQYFAQFNIPSWSEEHSPLYDLDSYAT